MSKLPQYAVVKTATMRRAACSWFDTENEAKQWLAFLARCATDSRHPNAAAHYGQPRVILPRAEALKLP